MSKKKPQTEQMSENTAWIIEHFDKKENTWKSSNLNAMREQRWTEEAAIDYNHDLLTVGHTYEHCTEILNQMKEQRRTINPLAYRFKNLVTDQIVSVAILVGP